MPDSRERVIRCACNMIVAEGIEGFSLRKLARSLDVTAPSIYRHFRGKEGVLRAVISEAFKVLSTYLYAALEAPTAQERLSRTGERYVAFALDHPRFYEIIHMSPAMLGLTALPAEVQSQAQATRQFLIDRVRECMTEGVLAEDDPEIVAAAVWTYSHGLVSLYLGGQLVMERDQFPAFFRVLASRLFTGIGGHMLALPPDVTSPPTNITTLVGQAARVRTTA